MLAAGSTTKILVNSTAGSSTNVSLPVVPAKPGVFAYEAGGGGQAKAVNQDGSLNGDGSINGTDKAAAPGTVIAIYATGLGPFNPPIPQGAAAPASPLSTATLAISATIGGRSADVPYAGSAPGLVGVYQVNILVPLVTPSGANAIVLTAGGNASQDGVTVQIK
jgi:uncharacterized protein (TIGR03437 family)